MPFLKRHVQRKIFIFTMVSLWVIFVVGNIIGHGNGGSFARVLEFAGMDWMASIFLIFVCLLAVDVVTVFGYILPGLAPAIRGFSLLAGIALSLIAFIQGMRPPIVQNYEVSLAGLPAKMDGTVIVAMSDLHLGSLLGESWLNERIKQVEAEKPDMIVLLGDITEGHGRSQDVFTPILHKLSAPYGVWAVLGNHESHRNENSGNIWMKESGLQVLHNRWVEIKPGLVLAGVDDFTAGRRLNEKVDYISKALDKKPKGAVILLSHTPWFTEKAAGAGAGLMLCGHTHDGQIWPFGYLVKTRYPLLGGRYEVNGMTVIVCRGTGTWGPRMRLWRPGEILRIKLHNKNKKLN
ncbi:MAG: metallophosphoesterase [Elusimicrobia bacterium]|nr:metallophosphoesterase [Elusimicrobiota bacterium]